MLKFQRKTYEEAQNVGRAKYVVAYHDGKTTHRDGSPFFDVAVFRNRRMKTAFVNRLKAAGYEERSSFN